LVPPLHKFWAQFRHHPAWRAGSPAAPHRRRFADELLLGRPRVLPNEAMNNGFVFRHETLRSAFEAIL
jgi:NAD dependent epimerase/dehydratase family enzyme